MRRSGQRGDHALHDRMVDAQHREAVERDVADESLERLLQRGEIAVEIEVLGIDVGDDRDRRRQPGEGAVALVGLDDHPVAGAEPRVGAVGVDDAAIDHGRVEPGGLQQRADHRGRRRLAVRAGDRDRPFAAASARPASRRGARPAGGAPAPRRSSGLSGLTAEETTTTSAPPRFSARVADRDRNAELGEPPGVGAFGEIAALHLVAEIVQDLGDAAHADAADADEMDRADRSGQRSHAARSACAADQPAPARQHQRRQPLGGVIAGEAAGLRRRVGRAARRRRAARRGARSASAAVSDRLAGSTQPAPASAKARGIGGLVIVHRVADRAPATPAGRRRPVRRSSRRRSGRSPDARAPGAPAHR